MLIGEAYHCEQERNSGGPRGWEIQSKGCLRGTRALPNNSKAIQIPLRDASNPLTPSKFPVWLST